MLAVYTVDSIESDGPGSLLEATTLANESIGVADEIVFAAELSGATIAIEVGLGFYDELVVDASSLDEPVTISVAKEYNGFGFDGDVVVRGVSFKGPIRNHGTLRLEEVTVVGNGKISSSDGVLTNYGDLVISKSLFHDNVGAGSASVLENNGDATIVDSTFTHNRSEFDTYQPGPRKDGDYGDYTVIRTRNRGLTIERSTIVAGPESHGEFGAAIRVNETSFPPGVIQITGSIIDGPIRPIVANEPLWFSFVGDGNLFSDSQAPIEGAGNLFGVNPRLAPLADNGGPTLTRALLPGSPAIDAGPIDTGLAPSATDARGEAYTRVADGGSGTLRIDIGAYEAQAAPTAAPGDFNRDGAIDAADYTVWRDSLGAVVTPLSAADATGDGVVDEADRDAWRSHYGSVPIGTEIVVNDLADDDDRNIENGRTTLREAIRFANDTPWAKRIVFAAELDGGVLHPLGVASGAISSAYVINSELTIDASALPNGVTIDTSVYFDSTHWITPVERVFWVRSASDRSVQPFNMSNNELVSSRFQFTIAGLNLRHDLISRSRIQPFIDAATHGGVVLKKVDIETPSDKLRSAISSFGPITLIDSQLRGAGIETRRSVELVRSSISDAPKAGVSETSIDEPADLQFWPTPYLPPEVTLIDSVITGSGDSGIDWGGM